MRSRGCREWVEVVSWLAVLATLSALAACRSGDDAPAAGPAPLAGAAEERPTGPSFEVEQVPPSPREPVPPALEISEDIEQATTIRFEHPAFGPPQVRSGDLQRGGPEPDGIPAIDNPRFHHVPEVGFLRDDEPVVVLEVDGDGRAYPLQIMIWHEIVNDTVGGVPVAVTYCPLCNSAYVFDRRQAGRVLDFGVSGALWNSSMVMYDRQTRSLWGHFTGQGLLGVLAGEQLADVPVTIASWRQFAAAHPDGLVLSRDTGFPKDYGRNPYPGYDDVSEPPFLFEGSVDGRLAAKTRVVGVAGRATAVAVTATRLERDRVVPLELEGSQLVVWWQPGTASALEAETVAEGRDVGTTGAFRSTVDETRLRFEAVTDGGFRDLDTGSRWDVFGTATEGPLTGRRLEAVNHVDTFWFAWATFRPTTVVIG